MRTPEPLRNNPFRFRRRRSLNNILYGKNRSRPIIPKENMPHYSGSMGQVNSREYIPISQEQYMPHPGFMQMLQSDYEPYDELQDISMSNFGITADESRFAAMALADIRPSDGEIEYDDCLITKEVFMHQIELLREQFPPEFDTNETASRILAAFNQDEELDMEQNLQENMLEIQMAVEQARADSLAEPNSEISNFEQAEQMPESQLYEMQSAELDYGAQIEAEFNAQEATFEQPMEETVPMMDSGPQALENIVEAEQMQYEGAMPDDMSAMSDLMNERPVEQMYETPEHMELYPEQVQDGYGMMQPEMYDEQMQEMMDPFMMQGPLGPMGFGPGGGP